MQDYKKRFDDEWEKYYQRLLKNKNYYISKDVFKREFRKKLIDNNELDFISANFNELWDFIFNYNKEMLLYLKKHKDEIKYEHLIKIYKTILNNMFYFKDLKNELNREDARFINELYKRNLSLFDVNLLSQGSNSKVFEINNTIFKFGVRECYKIPDNNRIFYPEFKKFIGRNYVEITKKLDVKDNVELNSNVFEIYCELRDQNVIWLDPKSINIARLTKDDIISYNQNKEYKYENGIIKNQYLIERTLNEGDYVIIDLDLLYPEKNRYQASIEYFKLNNELQEIIKEYDKEYQRIKK